MKIRRFVDEFESLAEIFRSLYPEWPNDAEKVRKAEAEVPAHVMRERWVAEVDGRVVGTSVLNHNLHFFHPRQFHCNVWVLPEFQGRGVGRGLFDELWRRFAELPADWIECSIPERMERGARFLLERKFTESHRNFPSKFPLPEFDAAKFARAEERVRESGMKILTLPELAARDPEYRRKVFDLIHLVDRGIPAAELRPVQTFEQTWQRFDEKPHEFDPFLIALDGDRCVGLQFSGPVAGSDWFHVKLTGIHPDYRNRGLATILKARTMQIAKDRGYVTASTWNDSRNAPMLALNQQFGFERGPAYVSYLRRV